MKIKLPNLFVVGAAKAGTTSLYEYFKQHPQIFMTDDDMFKEPSYFCNLVKPLKTYDFYLSLFKEATDKHLRIGEASTSYLTCPESALRIKKYEEENNLDCRIIIMLRNPVSRAYSLYNWMVQYGYEWCGSFEKALKIEYKREQKKTSSSLLPAYFYNYLYFKSGLYYEQVKNYYKIFDNKKVRVIIFEKFVRNIDKSLVEIFNFLGVDENIEINKKKHNESKQVFSPKLQFILRKLTDHLVYRKLLKPRILAQKNFIVNFGILNHSPQGCLPDTKHLLLQKYKGDIALLQELIDEDLNIWLS